MIEGLREWLPAAALERLVTFDADASQVRSSQIPKLARLALIDGEHTVAAAFSDFLNLRRFIEKDAIIIFHDSNLVFDAIRNCEALLVDAGASFTTVFLPDQVAAIGLGELSEKLALETSPYSLPRVQFLSDVERALQKIVALQYIENGDLGFIRTVEVAFRAFLKKRERQKRGGRQAL